MDPARFRRPALLAAALQQLRGQDPDADLSLADRALAREVRTLLLDYPPGADDEERAIAEAMQRAQRILARKAKRLASGRQWGE